MTLRDRERAPANGRGRTAAPPTLPGTLLSRLSSLDAQATPLRLRAHQRVELGPAQDDLIYVIRSGVLTARIAMPTSDCGQISLFFPGDLITAGAVPCCAERGLVAATPAEVLRIKAKVLQRLICETPDLLAAYDRQRDRQLARASLNAAVLATLDGPQRLAAFLIEMALEIGIPAGTAVAIDLPVSRTQIAEYLALNADTLSRLMSRFKADGLVGQKSRHQIVLRNWRAIAALCPLTPALIAIDRNRPSPLS